MMTLVVFLFVVSVASQGNEVEGVRYINVGGTGSYDLVTNMIPNSGVWNVCPSGSCQKTEKVQMSSSLAPFDEDQTVAFRGPMNVYKIAVYYPRDDEWTRVSYWDNTNLNTQNLVWMNNAGSSAIGGDWSICQGNSQSYATTDGKEGAATPQNFSGWLGNDVNVNIMTTQHCNQDTCSGFTRNVSLLGWPGNSCGEKLFVFKVNMPHDTNGTNNVDMPAIWFLNGAIVRTNQWGCNCRGVGSPGGCGELDIAEVIPNEATTSCTTTLYSFKDSEGAAAYFARPVDDIVNFIVVFNANGTGMITIIKQPDSSWKNFDVSIPQSQVNTWINQTSPFFNVTLDYPYTGPSTCNNNPNIPPSSPPSSPSSATKGQILSILFILITIFCTFK